MIAAIKFEAPSAWFLLIPFAVVLLYAVRAQRRRGVSTGRMVALAAARAIVLLPLIGLAARPVRTAPETQSAGSHPVTILLDRSESMSLEENEGSRYQQALQFLNQRLLPALKSARLPIRIMAFDQGVASVDPAKLASLSPNGKQTDLAGAIVHALDGSPEPSLAVVSLTDGIATETSANPRALSALARAQVPFIGVGFGSDQGARTLSLRDIEAPGKVAPHTAFSISARLELLNCDNLPAFDLVLLRDGQLAQKKTVGASKGSRQWVENFPVTEPDPGNHNYTVQLAPPAMANLRCVNRQASASVRVSDENELRVLYVQGALTWDYKFINRALHDDPAIKLTGLTRTSQQSVFRQNVESAGELLNGFPSTLQELAPFRVIVLSNLRPADLSPPQQELLAKFCGEMGGGLLVLGGPATFDGSWQNSRLEQLLPVVFSPDAGVQGLDRPFRIQLTDEAVAQSLFQIADNQPVHQAWASLPPFLQYGRVDALKPGAQAWMVHPNDEGPRGKRILMASQRYGAGISAALCVQNFWRWRLAKDTDPAQFDRFWRQLFRFLSDAGRQDVAIHLADQDLHSRMDVRVILEKQPNPKNLIETRRKCLVRVEDSHKRVVADQAVELQPLQPVDFTFHAEQPDVYTVSVADALNTPIATRRIEIRELDVEFQETARNMDTLRQWAAASDGLALKAEDCPDARDLVARIKSRIEQVRRDSMSRRVVGVNAAVLAWILAGLGAEWVLRKRWGLV